MSKLNFMYEDENAMFNCLKSYSYPLQYALICQALNDYPNAPFQMILNNFEEMNLVDITMHGNHKAWSIKLSCLNEFKVAPKEYENNPYGYFLDKDRRQKEFDSRAKWYDSENAKTQFENFPIIEKRAKNSLFLAWFAIGLSVITLLIKWKCGN